MPINTNLSFWKVVSGELWVFYHGLHGLHGFLLLHYCHVIRFSRKEAKTQSFFCTQIWRIERMWLSVLCEGELWMFFLPRIARIARIFCHYIIVILKGPHAKYFNKLVIPTLWGILWSTSAIKINPFNPSNLRAYQCKLIILKGCGLWEGERVCCEWVGFEFKV